MKRIAALLAWVIGEAVRLGGAWRQARPVAAVRRGACGVLPGAMCAPPAAWRETDQTNLDAFLRTPSGKKFLLTLHDLTVSRALTPIDRTPYEHGITGGFSVMLSEIERLACEGEPEE
jgi:hypothetical protein